MKTSHAAIGMRTLSDFKPLWEQMESIHDGVSALARDNLSSLYQTRAPQFELIDEEDAYWLYAETSDVQERDITVTVNRGTLIVQGEQSTASYRDEHDSFLRPYRAFTRRFALREPVRTEAISTMCSDGKLTVCIPKVADRQIVQSETALV